MIGFNSSYIFVFYSLFCCCSMVLFVNLINFTDRLDGLFASSCLHQYLLLCIRHLLPLSIGSFWVL